MHSNTSRLYDKAVTDAQQEWGESAWEQLGERFQRALICERVLCTAALQDEDHVSDSRVRELVVDGYLRAQGVKS